MDQGFVSKPGQGWRVVVTEARAHDGVCKAPGRGLRSPSQAEWALLSAEALAGRSLLGSEVTLFSIRAHAPETLRMLAGTTSPKQS